MEPEKCDHCGNTGICVEFWNHRYICKSCYDERAHGEMLADSYWELEDS